MQFVSQLAEPSQFETVSILWVQRISGLHIFYLIADNDT